MPVATITSKGQLTVPKDVRELLGVAPGDKVVLTPDGQGGVTMRKSPVRSVTDLFGRFPTNGVRTAGEDLKETGREAAADHVMQSMGR